MPRRLHSSPSAQRGVGALVVVMVLFFIMSMVAAYASRNLIFEQKTSANNYRAVQAFEAAEAGLEWAIAMLNGGRVHQTCLPTADPFQTTFRDRHLSIDGNGAVGIAKWNNAGTPADLLPTCVRDNAGWNCSCPSNSGPVIVAPAGTGLAPSFQISFSNLATPDVAGRPVFRVTSQSCNSYGDRCFDPAGRKSDALAEVNALVALAVSLAQAPTAAITVRGDLIASDARVNNADGVVINVGGVFNPPPAVKNPNVTGPAGSPARVEEGDRSLPTAPWTARAGGQTLGEMMFLANFGMDPATYRTQPAVVRVACGAECAAAVQAAADQYPGRVLWIDGDLNVNAAMTLGTVASPVILIVGGNMAFGNASNVTIYGMVYSRGASWANGAGAALVRGAFVAEGDADDGHFTITGAPNIVFEPQVVDHLKKVQARRSLDFGSMVRVPGSWRDFQ